MEDPKFCKDCKHYRFQDGDINPKCLKTGRPNLVSGVMGYSECVFQRHSIDCYGVFCGPDAKWFEPARKRVYSYTGLNGETVVYPSTEVHYAKESDEEAKTQTN